MHAVPDTTAPTRPTRADFVKLDEVAAVLRCSDSTVRRLLTRGDLRSVYIGRRRLVPADALAEYLASLPGTGTRG